MKHERKSHEEHQFKGRAGWNDNHHLTPRSRGGSTLGSNLCRVDAYRHDAVHLLFGNHTLDEIILILQRLQRMKRRQRITKRIH